MPQLLEPPRSDSMSGPIVPPDIRPLTGETQADFAVRFHDITCETIPNTSARNAAMFRAWESAHPEGDDLARVSAEHWPTDKYTRIPNVAVFAEHSTKNRDGSTSKYDLSALRSIVERCNSRISDTGNYPAITEGHTPDQPSPEAGAPPVLGYSGPFRLGMIGNQKPRWAIFADEHWLKENESKIRSLPNRSPEVWLEPRMEDRFFDPIAALGATTPRLDLGMVRYGKRGDVLVEKYSASSLGAFSNHLPEQAQYEAGDSAMNDQDISRIVEAITSSAVFQWAAQKMSQEQGASQGAGAASQSPGGQSAPSRSPASPMQGANGEHSSPSPAPSMSGHAGSSPFGQSGAPHQAPGQSQHAGPQGGGGSDLDQDEKEIYGCLPDHARERFMAYRNRVRGGGAGATGGNPSTRGMYSADGETDPAEPVDGQEQTTDDNAGGSETTSTDSENSDMTDPVLQERYELLQRDHDDLRRQLGDIQADRTKVARYSKLSSLKDRGGFLFNVDQEVDRCAGMTDEQFETHRKVIVENYARIPTAHSVPELLVENSIEDRRQPEQFSVDDRDSVLKYARENNISDWGQALAGWRKQHAPEITTNKVA